MTGYMIRLVKLCLLIHSILVVDIIDQVCGYGAAIPERLAAIPERLAAIPERLAAIPERLAAIPERLAAFVNPSNLMYYIAISYVCI
jgi:hypothetical protein